MAEHSTKQIEEQPSGSPPFLDLFLKLPSNLMSELGIILLLGVFFFLRKLIKDSLVNWEREFSANFNQSKALFKCAIELRAASNADRVVIFQFTNSELSSTGLPFQKLRIRKESHVSGLNDVARIQNSNTIDFESIPVDLKTLFNNHKLIVKDKCKEDNFHSIFDLNLIKAYSSYSELIMLGKTHVGVISFFFSRPLDDEKIHFLEKNIDFMNYKKELINTLAPKKSPLMRAINWIF